MAEQYYKDAQRLAQREFRTSVAKGEYPYLPRLDDFIPPERLVGGKDLGIDQIPSELITGTRTAGRSNAFSRGFLPLLDERTEFAGKWIALCKAHLEEGIRDSVKVYEYMNRFYVEEGNKRVSVLKFFDAPAIPAHVIRILPEQNGSKEVELYNAFLEFYSCTRLNLPEFSKASSYSEILRLIGKGAGDVLTREERSDMATAYHYFREAYDSAGKRQPAEVGDAMLAYIKVYGYEDLRGKTAAEIKRSVAKVREEISLQQQSEPIDVKLDPEERPTNILAKVLPKAPLKVAFIHDKNPESSGWVYAHELGRTHVDRVFDGDIVTTPYFNAMDSDPLAIIEQAIVDGNTVLFTTSPRLLPASLRAAVDHPKVTVLNCSLNTSHRYIRTYYARMYEVKFISGAIAAALSSGNELGYICDYPIYGQVASIDAFALGAQMINPLVKVILEWSSVGGVEDATKRLTDRGIKLISCQDTKSLRGDFRSNFGLAILHEDGQTTIARPIWQWGRYYEAILRSVRDGSFKAEYDESSKAINYYWGLSAGVVDIECSELIPESVRRLASILKESVRRGAEPFCGPLYDQSGNTIIGEDQLLTPEQIINIDWLAENVVGAIPAYDELTETGKATVGVVGVAGVDQTAKGGPSDQSGRGQT